MYERPAAGSTFLRLDSSLPSTKRKDGLDDGRTASTTEGRPRRRKDGLDDGCERVGLIFFEEEAHSCTLSSSSCEGSREEEEKDCRRHHYHRKEGR
ncbi:MAG: hypothetical protein WC483_01110 [Candidatus Paceibacterota bacterium]